MKNTKWVFWSLSIFLVFGLILSPGCAKKEETEEPAYEAAQAEQVEAEEAEEPATAEPTIVLPEAVSTVVEENFPGAEVYFIDQAEHFGIVVYDIELKANQGEVEVAEDGTIIDIITIVTMDELPEAAAQTIQAAAEGMTIKRLEKTEIWSEVKVKDEQGAIIKLETPKYIYKAEVEKDGRTGEISVDANGSIIKPLKWVTN